MRRENWHYYAILPLLMVTDRKKELKPQNNLPFINLFLMLLINTLVLIKYATQHDAWEISRIILRTLKNTLKIYLNVCRYLFNI